MSGEGGQGEQTSLVPAIPESLAAFEGTSDVCLILGSGLSALVDHLGEASSVPYADISGFPRPPYEVSGHGGRLVFATAGGARVAAFRGRIHRYQGFSAREVAYPVMLASALGCSTLVVTNAAGGLDVSFAPGDIMVITDHINLMGDNPLVGWPGHEGGAPFVAMGDAYDPELVTLAFEVAGELSISLRQGVYAGLLGPTYETPAEVEMLTRLGASVVGMSTVPEVIAARALGMRVLGISLVTNVAGDSATSHRDVLEMGARAEGAMTELVLGILGHLSA